MWAVKLKIAEEPNLRWASPWARFKTQKETNKTNHNKQVSKKGRTMMAHYPLHHLLHNPSSFISLTLPQHSPRLQTSSLPKTLSCHLSSSHNNKCSSNSIISSLTKIHSKPLHFALSGALSFCLLFGGISHYSNLIIYFLCCKILKILEFGRSWNCWGCY